MIESSVPLLRFRLSIPALNLTRLRCYSRLLCVAAALATVCGCSTFPTGQTRTSLWRCQGKENTLYLLGSIHILPETAYPLPAPMEKAFANSGRLVLEVDLGATTTRKVMSAFGQVGVYPPNDRLSNHISPSTHQALVIVLKALNMSPKAAERLRPAFLAEVITSRVATLAGFRSDLGVDQHFYQEAKKSGKPTAGLETVEDQAHVFQLSDSENEAYLRSTLANLATYPVVLQEISTAWRRGDTERLDGLLNEDERADPTLYAQMFTRRNERWLPQIEDMFQRPENQLVIVGAGHLVGRYGLLNALRLRGYRLHQL
jgi:uncharacterized protein